jgi:Family of unknown function (DUF5984)
MPLFEFELTPIELVTPWGAPPAQSLSWFALTLGAFRMPVGTSFLFQYTPEVLAHWGEDPASRDATHQIAAFARDALGSAAAGAASMPRLFEDIAGDADLRRRLLRVSNEIAARSDEDQQRDYAAWRWLAERSPWMSYLVARPRFAFLRVGDDVHVAWDNSDVVIEGMRVWNAESGVLVLSVQAFLAECRSFANCLLASMEGRIEAIATGQARPCVSVDVGALREQHGAWTRELGAYFGSYTPDIEWRNAESALREIAREGGIRLSRERLSSATVAPLDVASCLRSGYRRGLASHPRGCETRLRIHQGSFMGS